MFSMVNPPNYLIANDDNIVTVITAILFNDVNFYELIFELLTIYFHEREQNLKKILIRLNKIDPQYF